MSKIKTLKEVDRTKVVSLKQIHADPLIKLKKFDGAFTGLGPGIDQNGNPSTGLTEDFKSLEGKGTLTQGTRRGMEILLQLPEGTLKPQSPYWNQFYIRMDSSTIELDLSDDTSLLKYLFAKGQSIVADGLDEVETNANAEFVLFSQEQEAKVRVVKRNSLKEAYAKASELDITAQIDILAVYGINADATKPNTIIDKIDEQLEADPEKFLTLLKDTNLEYRSLVSKCLGKGILTIQDGAIYHGDFSVGYDMDSTVMAVAKDLKLQTILKAKLSGDMDLIAESFKVK